MRHLAILLAALLLAACVERVAVYSPRRSDTEAHRQAKSVSDCLGCHSIKDRPHHSTEDDCFRCHKLCRGC